MSFIDVTAHRRFAPEKMQKVNLFETADMFCDIYCLAPGQSQRAHAHGNATKFYYVLEGRPTVLIGDERRTLAPGELAYAPRGVEHGVENGSEGPVVLLVAMGPNPNVKAKQT